MTLSRSQKGQWFGIFSGVLVIHNMSTMQKYLTTSTQNGTIILKKVFSFSNVRHLIVGSVVGVYTSHRLTIRKLPATGIEAGPED